MNAQSGAANSFIQTNFNATIGGIASDWLITPVLELENNATISFYTQTNVPVNTTFPNELQVWESQSGSSTVNVGSTAATPGGDFTVLLLDINPGATAENGTPGGYPTTWTEYTLTISGLSAPTPGRIGFRYYLPDAATQGTTIGIDTFSFADPPPPPTLFTRTVSGNWTDTTGWTPNGVPNGNTATAQLVNPQLKRWPHWVTQYGLFTIECPVSDSFQSFTTWYMDRNPAANSMTCAGAIDSPWRTSSTKNDYPPEARTLAPRQFRAA